MAYVIAEPCIGTKDTACVDACPVDCIHPKFEQEALCIIQNGLDRGVSARLIRRAADATKLRTHVLGHPGQRLGSSAGSRGMKRCPSKSPSTCVRRGRKRSAGKIEIHAQLGPEFIWTFV
jgi:NAD-dependent dihydropyrimidine dehydrogenase PreA subunit